MGEFTSIEWADTTLNTAWGCTKISKGCEKCYMFRLSKRFGRNPEDPKPRKMENIVKDLNKLGQKGRVIFFNSMTDTYHENFSDSQLIEWFDLMKKYPQHQFIILTKRINRAFNFHKKYPVLDNWWIGTSIENRSCLHRMVKLKKIQAKIRFVSFEPLLENLYEIDLKGLQWVIVGGESDFTDPRPFNEMWALTILAQCRRDNVPFFYKQSGGKKKIDGCWGTNTIDGKKYLEMPIALATKESTVLN